MCYTNKASLQVVGTFSRLQWRVSLSESPADPGRINAVLAEAGFLAYPRGEGVLSVLFAGDLRPWAVDVRISNGWVCLRTHIMTLPQSPATRLSLFSAVIAANDRLSLVKFTVAWTNALCLDIQYLESHVDAPTLSRLVWTLRNIAEQEYPHLLSIATARETLEDLERTFQRSPQT